MDTVSEILGRVRDRFGIAFSEVHTGGGCMALEARLESGHWIVATDEALCGFRERLAFETSEDHPAMGWSVGIYPNNTDYGDDWWGGVDSVVDVTDYDAYARDLPDVIARALSVFMDNR